LKTLLWTRPGTRQRHLDVFETELWPYHNRRGTPEN